MENFASDLFARKVVLVTGGGTGIGRACALQLGRLGARVVIASRSEEHLPSNPCALRGNLCTLRGNLCPYIDVDRFGYGYTSRYR